MIRWENECVGCERCVDCGRRRVPVMVCDICRAECDELWEYEGDQLCGFCLIREVPRVSPGEVEE